MFSNHYASIYIITFVVGNYCARQRLPNNENLGDTHTLNNPCYALQKLDYYTTYFVAMADFYCFMTLVVSHLAFKTYTFTW